MADDPLEINNLTPVVKFRKGPHRARPMPKEEAEVHELPLPDGDRISPTDLLSALARDPSPQFQRALVVMSRQESCPCGCGTETELVSVFTAGEMSNERINWLADKMKFYAMGMEIGEEE